MRVIYGKPGPELLEASRLGEVMLGGCVPSSRAAQCPCGFTAYDSKGGQLVRADSSDNDNAH